MLYWNYFKLKFLDWDLLYDFCHFPQSGIGITNFWVLSFVLIKLSHKFPFSTGTWRFVTIISRIDFPIGLLHIKSIAIFHTHCWWTLEALHYVILSSLLVLKRTLHSTRLKLKHIKLWQLKNYYCLFHVYWHPREGGLRECGREVRMTYSTGALSTHCYSPEQPFWIICTVWAVCMCGYWSKHWHTKCYLTSEYMLCHLLA